MDFNGLNMFGGDEEVPRGEGEPFVCMFRSYGTRVKKEIDLPIPYIFRIRTSSNRIIPLSYFPLSRRGSLLVKTKRELGIHPPFGETGTNEKSKDNIRIICNITLLYLQKNQVIQNNYISTFVTGGASSVRKRETFYKEGGKCFTWRKWILRRNSKNT